MYKIQNESTTETISTQAIAPGGASVTVNGNSLNPSPFVSISIDQYRSGELVLGGVMNVSLNGSVVGDSFSETTGLAKGIMAIGKSGDCVNVNINCDGTFINGYGTIKSISINEGPDPTWIQLITYNIELELYTNENDLIVKPNTNASSHVSTNEIIKDLTESVTLNVDNDGFQTDNMNGKFVGKAHAKHSFSITATGAAVGCSVISQKTGIEAAEEVVKRRVSSIADGNIASGLGNPPEIMGQLTTYHGGAKYMHVRSLDADPVSGSVTVSGDVIMRPSGCEFPQAFIDVSVDSRSDATGLGESVVISGTIEGLHSHDFSTIITNGIFHGSNIDRTGVADGVYQTLKGDFEGLANAYLNGLITDDCATPGLFNLCYSKVDATQCNVRKINENVTRNFGSGTVSFSVEYSTAQICNIVGAAKVEIECTHTYPTDVFAEFTIPFRGSPLTQDLGTTTKEVISCTGSATVENQGCDVRVLTDIAGCLDSRIIEAAQGEGAGADWYVTQKTKTYSNNGTLRMTREYTNRYDCN